MVLKKMNRLDIFGLPVMLFYHNDYKYRSLVGIFLSISFFIFMGIYVFMSLLPAITSEKKKEFTYVSKSTTKM